MSQPRELSVINHAWTARPEIIYIDNECTLRDHAPRLLSSRVIGLDTETRPVFHTTTPPYPVSIMQLCPVDDAQPGGFSNLVYILDLLVLFPLASNVFSSVLGSLFSSPDILILGVGIENDLRQLRSSYPYVPCFRRFASVLDIGFIRDFNMSNPPPPPPSSAHITTGQPRPRGVALRELAFRIAGVHISKSQCRSNWADRPLSDAQLCYAANDSRALVHIFCMANQDERRFWPRKHVVDCYKIRLFQCPNCKAVFPTKGLLIASCRVSCGTHKRVVERCAVWLDDDQLRLHRSNYLASFHNNHTPHDFYDSPMV